VQAADAGVAQVAEDELAGHAGSDHLIVNQIGRQATEDKVALALANDLMGSGEADEGGEALDRQGTAVDHVTLDGLSHG